MVHPALILLGILALSLHACRAVTFAPEGRAQADAVADSAGLQHAIRTAGVFDIAIWWRGRLRDDGPWRVYIEGDGRAWEARNRISADPTPADPLGLRLAAADTAARVLYLARPCQYVTGDARRNCHPRYWTDARYGKAVIAAYQTLLSDLLSPNARLRLIGYSGGGVIAGLLAARLANVSDWVSVAANLDHGAWTAYHRVSPLRDSLQLWDDVEALARLPQWHLWGSEDRISPAAIEAALLTRLDSQGWAGKTIVAGFDHHCCWVGEWPRLSTELETNLGALDP
ncbi:MAG: hypothetical protein KDH88_06375 [Chromatiales bacterium]|nr:hypothetical protein [Chromatiales bacterium]